MDSQNECFNEKEDREERKFNSSIWIVFTVILSAIFLFVVYLNIQEIVLKTNGTKITTKYLPYNDKVSIKGEYGTPLVIDFGGQFPSHRDHEIDLYYYDNIADAKPLTMLGFWIGSELFFGSLTLVCFFRAKKNLMPTHHYKGA